MSKKAARKSGKKKAPAKPAKKASSKAGKASKKPARKAPPRQPASKKASTKKFASKTPGKGSAPSSSRVLVNQLLESFRFTAKFADAQLEGLPDEHALAQLPGADNHKAWTLGHQAISRAWFASSIGGTLPKMPEAYPALFGTASKPTSDPGLYPPLDELRTNYRAGFDAIVSAIESLTDADLQKPAHGDSGGFITTRMDAIVKAVWHEGWHGGQIATLRRGLGLPHLM
jgi:hypothetical protein